MNVKFEDPLNSQGIFLSLEQKEKNMTHYDNCLYDYQNGNYRVVILEDGTKIRETEEDKFIPAFAENSDVKITDRCDGGCPFCYEGCTVNGKHAHLFDENGNVVYTQKWLTSLHPGTELALNGNDLSHPELHPSNPRLLTYLKEHGIITNMTVNQKHFMKYYDVLKKWCDEKLIYGLGVSLADSSDTEFIKRIQEFPNAVIHVIAGIFEAMDVHFLADKGLKLLILGYKNLGRGTAYFDNYSGTILHMVDWLSDKLPTILKHFKVVSFDNLAIDQLNVKTVLFKHDEKKWSEFYMGDDGSSTFYLDAVKMQYSRDSCMPREERFSSVGKTVDEMFQDIRSKYINK